MSWRVETALPDLNCKDHVIMPLEEFGFETDRTLFGKFEAVSFVLV